MIGHPPVFHKGRRRPDGQILPSDCETCGIHIAAADRWCRQCCPRAQVTIWSPSNVHPEAVIGRETRIGAFANIDRGVRIGARCRIQAHVFLPPGTVVGDDVFLGPGVVVTNDKYPPSGRLVGTTIADGAVIGARAVIGPGVTIGPRAVVGMGAVVTHDVPAGTVVWGCPARVQDGRAHYDDAQAHYQQEVAP